MMWSTAFLVNVAPAGNEATCRFKDLGGIIDTLENDVVAPPQYDGTLSDEDETFLDVHSDSDKLNPLPVHTCCNYLTAHLFPCLR